jgi:carboxyvinyl-carboxyphosphonate phosphorylmutase
MNATERRNRLRQVLAGSACVSPASVYDPLSARAAESVGYELGFLAGSVASETTLGAPDMLGGLTLTELAERVRGITRASDLSLIVDADHGYGNALNVMRTVEELEHAGVAGLTLEDTLLPSAFGSPKEQLISVEEGVGKMKAALAARRDPSLVIVARSSLNLGGLDELIVRLKAYAELGADAFFVAGGLKLLTQLDAMHAAAKLPILLGTVPPALKREELARRGARLMLHGHQPLAASLKALQKTYRHLHAGGAPADLKPDLLPEQDMEKLIREDRYQRWRREFLS